MPSQSPAHPTPRSSGVLLHPTSLPGPSGIGDLGQSARQWIEFLAASKQTIWQVLPLGPTGYADSPYACLSAFSGNPLLISLQELVHNGDLSSADLGSVPQFDDDTIDYGAVIEYKMPLIIRAAQNFGQASSKRQSCYANFCRQQKDWLPDYALFASLKQVHNNAIWYEWDEAIALRQSAALAHWQQILSNEIEIQQIVQFFFFEQWTAIKTLANQNDIRIVGDVPIFVATDSADVWANPDLFHLDEHGHPTLISGVPPDYFSETGQRWGNPLYRWDVIAESGYDWWIRRVEAMLDKVDIVRIDHFRGFIAYWEIPASEPTAVKGRWLPGPGSAVFEAIEQKLGKLPIWAEDLGVITPEVINLREQFGFPGMKILQFAFDQKALHASFGDYQRNPFLPHNYTSNFVVYTGTHDNDTTLGWFQNCPAQERQAALDYLGLPKARSLSLSKAEPVKAPPELTEGWSPNWTLIRAAMASVAQTAVFPLQDLLGLGTETRMNLPGTSDGNWQWRYRADALDHTLAARLARLTELYERVP